MITKPYLIKLSEKSQKKIFLQFGGQENSYFTELKRLYKSYPELKSFFEFVFDVIEEGLSYLKPSVNHQKYGLDLKKWLEGKDTPPDCYLNNSSIVLPCIHVTQMAYYHLLALSGHDFSELNKTISGVTGYGIGFHSACLVALGLEGDQFFDAFRKFILFALIGGYRCQQVYPLHSLPGFLLERSQRYDKKAPTTMAAITGLTVSDLVHRLYEVNRFLPKEYEITISLENTMKRLVVSGREQDLILLREHYFSEWEKQGISWDYLDVTAPYHSHLLSMAWDIFERDNSKIGFHYTGDDLKIPIFSCFNGNNVQSVEELYRFSFLLITSKPLSWLRAIKEV